MGVTRAFAHWMSRRGLDTTAGPRKKIFLISTAGNISGAVYTISVQIVSLSRGDHQTGISYLMAAANLAAARIEEEARIGEDVVVQTKVTKIPSDINMRNPEWAMRYIADKKKRDGWGSVFLTVWKGIGE